MTIDLDDYSTVTFMTLRRIEEPHVGGREVGEEDRGRR